MSESKQQLSPTMRAAVIYAKKFQNKIVRYQGGYWARANWEGAHKEHWFSTSTIQALVSRGLADYTQWQDGRAGHFPIEVTLTPLAEKES